MFHSCFCCCPIRRGFVKRSSRSRSSLVDRHVNVNNVSPTAVIAVPSAKRKYRFHKSIIMRYKRKNSKQETSCNRTVFVVPSYCVSPKTTTSFDVESSLKLTRAAFSVTVEPETRFEQQKPKTDNESFHQENEKKTTDDNSDTLQLQSSNNSSMSNNTIEKSDGSAILETRFVNLDDRQIRPNDRKSLSLTSVNSYTKPNVQSCSTSTDQFHSQNDKPIAEVKPTTMYIVQPLTERRKSIGSHLKKQEKRLNDTSQSFTPFNEPQKALQLVSVQINSPEWESAVIGLQNISRLSMFHGKELRPNSLQPFVRIVAKHIKSLRSQVTRAACIAIQKMFSFVPKSVEPDVEEIASALFPRTADTNKFLRCQSAEAFNAMVDNVNPIKCINVITSQGIKHGNRLVRAEACRLLARIVDKLGVSGTLHLPTDARDAVITAATSMVFDNTPTSRQAAQHILAKLSEDPRGAALISSAASPNVKATLNKSLSRIFLK